MPKTVCPECRGRGTVERNVVTPGYAEMDVEVTCYACSGTGKVDVDVSIENHGSIFLFRLNTDAAGEWVDQNVDLPDYMLQGDGSAIFVEHRAARPLAAGMETAGLTVR
jgi:hypothetical protein